MDANTQPLVEGTTTLPETMMGHVSWKVILVWMFRWAAFLFLLVATVAFLESYVPALSKFGLSELMMKFAGAVLLLLLIYDVVRYNGIKYALTPKGVYFEYGILKKKHFIAPYEGIQDIDVETSLLERILGIGTVVIETAGISAKKIEESFEIPGIENPRRFARVIIERAAEAKKPQSIENFKKDLEKLVFEISELKEGLEGVGNSLEFYEDRIKSMETIISALEAKVVSLAEEKRQLAKKLEALKKEQEEKRALEEEIRKSVEKTKPAPSKRKKSPTTKKSTAKAAAKKTTAAKRATKRSTSTKKGTRTTKAKKKAKE